MSRSSLLRRRVDRLFGRHLEREVALAIRDAAAEFELYPDEVRELRAEVAGWLKRGCPLSPHLLDDFIQRTAQELGIDEAEFRIQLERTTAG